MTMCITQRQCLDPWLTYDEPDCITRRSCEEPFVQGGDIKTVETVPTVVVVNGPNINSNYRHTSIHATPVSTVPKTIENVLPVDVFSIMILAAMVVIVTWLIAGFIVKPKL